MIHHPKPLPFSAALLAAALGLAACSSDPGNGGPGDLAATDLTVSPAEARACELVLEADVTATIDATFTGVTGAILREAPRTAVSFTADADLPIAPGAVKILSSGTAAPKITRARCFDRTGRVITSAQVGLGR